MLMTLYAYPCHPWKCLRSCRCITTELPHSHKGIGYYLRNLVQSICTKVRAITHDLTQSILKGGFYLVNHLLELALAEIRWRADLLHQELEESCVAPTWRLLYLSLSATTLIGNSQINSTKWFGVAALYYSCHLSFRESRNGLYGLETPVSS